MAARPYKRTNRQAIPRKDLQGKTSRIVMDSRNNPTGSLEELFTLHTCTIQPASAADLKVLDEGTRDAEAFTIFTSTVVRVALRGTDQKADEVYLEAPYTAIAGWFTVLKSKPWQTGIVPHYQLLVMRKNPN